MVFIDIGENDLCVWIFGLLSSRVIHIILFGRISQNRYVFIWLIKVKYIARYKIYEEKISTVFFVVKILFLVIESYQRE